MPDTTYAIEYAKSSRSKCKKCKETLVKGDMRICVTVPSADSDGFDMTSYFHPDCFKLPRRFASGPDKISIDEFVELFLVDNSGGYILPSRKDEIVTMITLASAKKAAGAAGGGCKRKAAGDDDGSGAADTLMARLKQAYKSGEPPKKKHRSEGNINDMMELYEKYCKLKVDVLKDYLRWNRQVLGGNKDFVLFKVIDGELNGRLGYCGLCGGRLKYAENDEDHIICSGRFDEDMNMRIPCDNKMSCRVAGAGSQIPRLQPWYTREPTDDEKDKMDKAAEEARGEGGTGGGIGGGGDSDQVKAILTAAEGMGWDLNDRAGIQQATKELLAIVKGKVDLPDGKNAKMKIGPIVVANKNKSPKEIAQAVIDKFGFKEDKEQKAQQKTKALQLVCENAKNAPLIMAIQELAGYYFKEGNRNAGGTYNKVIAALKSMPSEVTTKNVMGLSKGKTKVAGIGKSSAEKMKEFLETGTMTKLEEKRAVHAG